jgi:hypothetical protein
VNEKSMKKPSKERVEMRSEYAFTNQTGVRGKYRAYREGHEVRVCKEAGNTEVQYFCLKDGAIMLEPDVQQYFPDSESVNSALRTLITLIPEKGAKQKTSKPR